jgi:spore germination cell wall hydrolase CwlJ-like protein
MASIKLSIIFILVLFSSVAYSQEETDELKCLVEAIYHEARSEPFVGQLAVANVILERTNLHKFPDTICKVVHAGHRWEGNIIRNRCAFSYFCDGKKEWTNIDKKALDTAYDVAGLALKGVMVMPLLGATHYHASYVNPRWANYMEKLGQIGIHIFYVD